METQGPCLVRLSSKLLKSRNKLVLEAHRRIAYCKEDPDEAIAECNGRERRVTCRTVSGGAKALPGRSPEPRPLPAAIRGSQHAPDMLLLDLFQAYESSRRRATHPRGRTVPGRWSTPIRSDRPEDGGSLDDVPQFPEVPRPRMAFHRPHRLLRESGEAAVVDLCRRKRATASRATRDPVDDRATAGSRSG